MPSKNYGTGFSINVCSVECDENVTPMKSFFDEISETIKPYDQQQASKSQALNMYIAPNVKEFNKVIKAIENDQ